MMIVVPAFDQLGFRRSQHSDALDQNLDLDQYLVIEYPPLCYRANKSLGTNATHWLKCRQYICVQRCETLQTT